MDIKTKITANFSKKDLEEVLKETMKKQMPGYEVHNITFNVQDTADDRFGGGPNFTFVGVDVEMGPRRPAC